MRQETENKKYKLDTPENKAFLKEIREDLLRFGRRFPSESGASYYLGDDGAPLRDRPPSASEGGTSIRGLAL